MELSIRRIKSSSGERFVVLVDSVGMPLFYPALYVTVHMRGRSLAVNTIQNTLNAIKALYAWQSFYCIDIESRFSCCELLQTHEVHSMRDFMQKPLVDKNNGKAVSISRRDRTVSVRNQYARMSVIADYLGFLAGQLQKPSTQGNENIKRMVSQIKANRPKKPTKSIIDRDEKRLDDSDLDALEKALKPGSNNNPAHEYAVQVRNALIFSILRVTGLRRGELLNLKIEDIDFAKNTLKVVRRPDSTGDARVYQPVVKTRERTFPLMPELVDQVRGYVLGYRNKVPGAKKHGYLFVTHKSGTSEGLPFSNSGFGKFMGELKHIVEGYCFIHAHSLRHHWNYSFSKTCENQGMTPEREEKLRSYLMGWSETSGTAATYNRRYIKEQAGKAVLELQNKHLGKVRKGM
ncbi:MULTISPECIES: tyrosine-type recombinase/integrase [Enterobacteriaceae]|uniref:Site-specific integrase n=2 Tax=Enterobacteriaceae TaxID=543 RepID=A0A9X7L2Q2_9ENTR|nr:MULTISPECIES: site-specific integrase [Enterobacteriaceae]MBH0126389.1 site-specific integrase [Enterobacter sp. SECR18-0236]MBZ7338405.1 site-specific integrase [Klebsiella grimontii]MCU3020506.1 site-specific integrase [Enterobacter hormaechei subsp. hoffmannii]HAT3944710.1 site-specific integrase [Kluyvera ascorbata]HCJ7418372.1 site-specific integrase [Enterobacter hormaechei subsp. xiangfangensis]